MEKFIKSSILLLFISVGLFTSCTKNEVSDIKLNISSANFTVGQTDSLIATITAKGDLSKFPQIWSTSNSSIVTVKDGFITGVNIGTATITVKAGDKSATCDVTIVDKISPVLTQGILYYFGDFYKTKTDSLKNNESNNFVAYLADNNVNLNDYFSGDGERLILEFNTDTLAVDSLPVGTYDMMTDLTLDKLGSKTLVPAYYDSSYNEWGCWYYKMKSSKLASFNEAVVGTVVVALKNKIYTLTYNLIDYYGNTISGTYHGALTYYNNSSQAAPAALKNKKNISIGKSITNFPKFKRR